MVPQLSGVTTTWVVGQVESPIGTRNTPLRKDFRFALINKISTSMLPSTYVDIL
mgnify:CR=1 FL=1